MVAIDIARPLASLLFLFPPFPAISGYQKAPKKEKKGRLTRSKLKMMRSAATATVHHHINIIHRKRLQSAPQVWRDSRTLPPRAVSIAGEAAGFNTGKGEKLAAAIMHRRARGCNFVWLLFSFSPFLWLNPTAPLRTRRPQSERSHGFHSTSATFLSLTSSTIFYRLSQEERQTQSGTHSSLPSPLSCLLL